MAGKKDQGIVIIGRNLTVSQSADLLAEFQKNKAKIAPNSSFTAAQSNFRDIGTLLNDGHNQLKLLGNGEAVEVNA